MKFLRFIKFVCEQVKNFCHGNKRKTKEWFYNVEYVNDFPDHPATYILYVLGKPGREWLAGINCPCGCGEFIELVLDGHSPNWQLFISDDGKPSLSPSVFRSINCHSHFFLRKGRIQWCRG
jgi:hypothetical protein